MPPTDSVVVVGNARARKVKGAWRREVERGFGPWARLEFLEATGRAELERIAREVAAARDRLLVVAGGDGTVSWVVNALGATPAILGLLPLGTANNLARGLALPHRLADAITRIRSGRRRRCNLLSVNGRRFCTVGGIGLAADSALGVQALRDSGNRPLRWALGRLRAPRLLAGGGRRVVAGRAREPLRHPLAAPGRFTRTVALARRTGDLRGEPDHRRRAASSLASVAKRRRCLRAVRPSGAFAGRAPHDAGAPRRRDAARGRRGHCHPRHLGADHLPAPDAILR